jgi:hypothetical protein
MQALEMSVASLRPRPTWLTRWLTRESGTHRVQDTRCGGPLSAQGGLPLHLDWVLRRRWGVTRSTLCSRSASLGFPALRFPPSPAFPSPSLTGLRLSLVAYS